MLIREQTVRGDVCYSFPISSSSSVNVNKLCIERDGEKKKRRGEGGGSAVGYTQRKKSKGL